MKARRQIKSIAGCPALALALEMEAVIAAYNAIDERGQADPRDDQRWTLLSDRIAALHDEASFVTPQSVDGAAFLLALAGGDHDMLITSVFSAERIKVDHEKRCARLISAALSFLMQNAERPKDWHSACEYFGGTLLTPDQAIAEAIQSTQGGRRAA